MQNTDRIFVDGVWRTPADGRPYDVIDPATEEVAATILLASEEDVNDAVAAARRAFPGFAALSPAERADLLEAIVV
jgi:aldehyde dehydrogenase (NAD+)